MEQSRVTATEDARAAVGAVHGNADHLAGAAGFADVLDLVEFSLAGRTLGEERPHAGEQFRPRSITEIITVRQPLGERRLGGEVGVEGGVRIPPTDEVARELHVEVALVVDEGQLFWIDFDDGSQLRGDAAVVPRYFWIAAIRPP